jgi:uncharacterized membrane protein
MAELEQQHRQELEDAQVALPYLLARRGQSFALAAMILFLLFAAALALAGATTAAAVIVGIDIVGIVGVFLTGRYVSRGDGSPEAEPDASADGGSPSA